MNSEVRSGPSVKHHTCPDETATVVNGRWMCNCPGGPYPAPPAKSPLPAQAGGGPVTPSALESALAKLRWIAVHGPHKAIHADEAVALLAYLTPTVPNSWNADEVLKRHGLYRELAPPDRGATALRLLWLEQQNAALLAKIEAADRLVEAAESQAADLGHTDTYLLDCAASYRNPQPTKIKPPCDLCEGTGVAVDYELGRSIGCPRGCSRTPQPAGGGE